MRANILCRDIQKHASGRKDSRHFRLDTAAHS